MTDKIALIEKLAQDIRAVDGDHTLGAAELAEKLVDLGWLQPVVDASATEEEEFVVQPPLKNYTVGEPVIVLRNGDWVPANVTDKNLDGTMLNVFTERGPLTIMSARNIQKVRAKLD